MNLRIEWDLFLHDIESKSFHMKSSSFFQFLVEFSLPMDDFGCSTHFVKFLSLSTCSTQCHMRIGNQVQELSQCIFKLLEVFHHLYFSSYLLVTLHLPWSLADGGSSKDDKMSSTHPNPILLVIMSSMRQMEDMSKNPF